jgi:NTP pyrophosphatase (non-canonical NTP hydrolase)
MDLNVYQRLAESTDKRTMVFYECKNCDGDRDCPLCGGTKTIPIPWAYPMLGLAAETGELANLLKKILRDTKGKVDSETREKIKLELGDCLWYIAIIAKRFDLNLDNVGEANIRKLLKRQEVERNKIQEQEEKDNLVTEEFRRTIRDHMN